MREAGHRAGLATEPYRLGHRDAGQRLDGHPPFERAVERQIDDAHAAAAELALEPELPGEHRRELRRRDLAATRRAAVGAGSGDDAAPPAHDRRGVAGPRSGAVARPGHRRLAQPQVLDLQGQRRGDRRQLRLIVTRERQVVQLLAQRHHADELVPGAQRHQQVHVAVGEPLLVVERQALHPSSRLIQLDHQRIRPRRERGGEPALERQRAQPVGARRQPPGLPVGDEDVGLRQVQRASNLIAEGLAHGVERVAARLGRRRGQRAEQRAGVDGLAEEHAVDPLEERPAHGEDEQQCRQGHQGRQRRGREQRADRLVAIAYQGDDEQHGRCRRQRDDREAGQRILHGAPHQHPHVHHPVDDHGVGGGQGNRQQQRIEHEPDQEPPRRHVDEGRIGRRTVASASTCAAIGRKPRARPATKTL